MNKKPYIIYMAFVFNQPNKKGPRFRKNLKRVINLEFIKKFKKEHPEISLSNKEIRLIMDTFHQLCKDVICETRDGLELPEQLGLLILTRMKLPHSKLMDERKAAIYKKKFPIPGYLCKIVYTNYSTKYKFKNAQLWGLEPGRPFKKQASENFTKNHTLYQISDNHNRINKMYYKANDIVREIVKENLRNKTEEE